MRKFIYVIMYNAYGTGVWQVNQSSFELKKDAELEARKLRACGHKAVTIIKTIKVSA